jgi:hypothetical protein
LACLCLFGIIITFWWLIWKERNKRILEDKEMSAQELANLIQESVNVHHLAWTLPSVSSLPDFSSSWFLSVLPVLLPLHPCGTLGGSYLNLLFGSAVCCDLQDVHPFFCFGRFLPGFYSSALVFTCLFSGGFLRGLCLDLS